MNFVDAARKGMDAHNRAIAARREQDEVLRDASKQMTDAFGTELTLCFTGVAKGLAAAILGGKREPPVLDTLEVTSKSGRSRKLASVSFGEMGYPLTLRWADRSEYAADREAFEATLQQLLESRAAGEQIAYVLARGEGEPGE